MAYPFPEPAHLRWTMGRQAGRRIALNVSLQFDSYFSNRYAKMLCGGAGPDGSGFYYPPTVLAAITPEMRHRVRARRQRVDQRCGRTAPVHLRARGRELSRQGIREFRNAKSVWKGAWPGASRRCQPG
jgi:hypothetical protein